MIYLDTSWLVKLYVDESDARAVRQVVNADANVVVSELAYVEFHSAVARRRRERAVTARTAATLLAHFRTDWLQLNRVAVSRDVLLHAAELVVAHPLRSLDALQLASALLIAEGAPDTLAFGTADDRLRSAARSHGLAALVASA